MSPKLCRLLHPSRGGSPEPGLARGRCRGLRALRGCNEAGFKGFRVLGFRVEGLGLNLNVKIAQKPYKGRVFGPQKR